MLNNILPGQIEELKSILQQKVSENHTRNTL